ncbi:hypothetical protein BMS3Bbin06_01793 [bacterium BMS3Bbin06]|nr:hypothetical protein BMS3Abin08_01015 [bacterium BMS3Abin08]GBE35255.1 hypothetical protein BMS3Bbin06_01793 [bacterium BMS3Bbin06]
MLLRSLRPYILKEYGSWTVLLLSYIAGLKMSGEAALSAVLGLVALSLYVNSKQCLALWLKKKGHGPHLFIFIVQVVVASLIIIYLTLGSFVTLAPFALVPLLYALFFISGRGHKLYTEVIGFATLSLSSLIARFLTAGELDIRLYVAVAVFFAAGVFKVRVQLRKGVRERFMMVAYVFFSLIVYYVCGLPVLIILPLSENLLHSLTLYRVPLKVTGWIEVAKGVAFIVLLRNLF